MSRDDLPHTCDACREEAFDFRRGRLSAPDREAIEEHLEECEECRDYFERLDTLLGAAEDHEPAPKASDSDEMFDAITDRIRERERDAGEEAPDREPASETGEQGAPNWRRYAAVAAAALVAGLLLGGILVGVFSGDSSTSTVATGSDPADETEPETASGDTAPGDPGSERQRFAELREVSTAPPDDGSAGGDAGGAPDTEIEELRLFASSGAEWSLERGREAKLHLERGRVLVEFVPRDDRELTVQMPGGAVRVVGTVFFASADSDGPRAGVLAGEVAVESESGETVRLRDGEETTSTFERRPMPEERRESLRAYVDLEEHRRRLERATARRDGSDETGGSRAERSGESDEGTERDERAAEESDGPAGERRPSGSSDRGSSETDRRLESLRERADRAASRGAYERAASHYRSFLDRAPDGHPGIGPVHLDLANLYIHRLDAPAKAVPHLKTYVRNWPDDVATPSAREELCRITRNLEEFDPDCD